MKVYDHDFNELVLESQVAPVSLRRVEDIPELDEIVLVRDSGDAEDSPLYTGFEGTVILVTATTAYVRLHWKWPDE